MRKTVLLLILILMASSVTSVVENGDTGVPASCHGVTGQENLTVYAGTAYAEGFSSKVFTYSDRVYSFEPCVNVSVKLVNNDSVRHQWMIHGLPEESYPMGMFTVEVSGPGSETGSFVTPNITETLLVHCGIPQHMQKGMKAMLKINGGDGEISNIPGHTGVRQEYRYTYSREQPPLMVWTGFTAAAGLLALLLTRLYFFRKNIDE